jgi:hypothetical protein
MPSGRQAVSLAARKSNFDVSWPRSSTANDTQGESVPLVVWNMLGWPRTNGTAVPRIYEAAGQPPKAEHRFFATVEAAEEVNLMEDPGSQLAVADNGLQFDLRAFEIKTIKLRLKPRGPVSPTPGSASRRDAAT